ncbi:MAG: hypothetical protein KBA86_02605 [Bacteroidales bacterium]|nr:hypothetical protein [Bacteroidales bacterium]
MAPIKITILTYTFTILVACGSLNSINHSDNNNKIIDSCDIAKKFENATIAERMIDKNFTGELKNYWGDDTTKLDFKYVFKNGKLVKSYFYYENGNLQEEYSFICDALHGIQKWYYEDGTLAKIIPYSYGYRQGTGKLFDDKGQLRQQVHFNSDSIVGDIIYYDESGKLIDNESINNE